MKRGGRLKPFSDKRKKKMQARAKERREAGEPTRHPGPCEVAGLLDGITHYAIWRARYLKGRPNAENEFPRNHVWGQRGQFDEPWNVVVMSEVAHEWEDKSWPNAGVLVCMKALLDRPFILGGMNPDERFYKRTIGYYPVGKLCNWVQSREFNYEPVLLCYAHELLTAYGYQWPLESPHPEDFGFGLL